MKPERAFVAERALARHCPDLLPAAPAPVDPGEALAGAGNRLSRALAAALTPLLGGEAPKVRARPVESIEARALANRIAPLAANSLIAAGPVRLIASVEAEPVLRLVDRAFGGRGDVPSPLPEVFPLSAELMIGRIEALLTGALSAAFEAAVPFVAIARNGDLAELDAFAPTERLALLELDVEEAGGEQWIATLAFAEAGLPALLGHAAPGVAPRPAAFPRDPMGEPFSGLPLTLSALLVDMALPLSALANLRVGQVLPVAVARSVPLRIGQTTIAHGTVGALDDCVALRITQAFD